MKMDFIIKVAGSEVHLDNKRCAVPFANNNGCSLCIKECIFNKVDYYKLRERAAGEA